MTRSSASSADDLEVVDLEPAAPAFLQAVWAGLSRDKKTLPTAFLYDEEGSRLFDRICEVDEYYPTRTELSIMDAHLPEMATALGPRVQLIEYGSGSGIKTHRLLQALQDPVAYVPVEISREHLLRSATALNQAFPSLEVLPVCADFTKPFEVPTPSRTPERKALYFPGSTLGNFMPQRAQALMAQMAAEVGPGGGVLMGIDLRKDPETLERAYNDAEGVTAAFNLNLLHRINRELGGDFDLAGFEHRAIWNPTRSAVEMRLFSLREQRVSIGGRTFAFARGESIHTEDSYKFTRDGFSELARAAGLRVEKVWTDPTPLFSVQYLRAL